MPELKGYKPMHNMGAIVQARMTSERFPGKVMQMLGKRIVLDHVISNLSRSDLLYIVATPQGPEQEPIWDWCAKNEVPCISPKCDENDVLSRYYLAAQAFKLDHIMRVTADCPMLRREFLRMLVDQYFENRCEYTGLDVPNTVPEGMDAEMFSMKTLKAAHENATDPYDREHVSVWMKKNCPYFLVTTPFNFSQLKLSVDTPEELERAAKWMEIFDARKF